MERKEVVDQLNRANVYIARKKYTEAEKILDRLKAMQTELNQQIELGLITADEAQEKMKQELQNAGQDVFSRY